MKQEIFEIMLFVQSGLIGVAIGAVLERWLERKSREKNKRP